MTFRELFLVLLHRNEPLRLFQPVLDEDHTYSDWLGPTPIYWFALKIGWVYSKMQGNFFWRTAAGLEADLLFDRGSERVIFEVKTGEGEVLRTLKRLEAAMSDTGAGRAYLITQADGILPLAPRVERRGFSSCLDWLP